MNLQAEVAIKYIEEKFDVELLAVTEIPKDLYNRICENALLSICNEEKLNQKDFQFRIYNIKCNKYSELYFSNKSHFHPYYGLTNPEKPLLLAFIEENTGYMSINSSRLFLEIDVYIGITHEDLISENNRYKQYTISKKTLDVYQKQDMSISDIRDIIK